VTGRALSSVRLDEDARFKYVLFIEGLTRAYTNDASAALTGSGIGSWIYTSELAAGDREIPGTREVVSGLIVPDTLAFAIDLRTGMQVPEPTTFQILDDDEQLATLFASEGKESERLCERIPPGVDDLGSSVATPDGGTTDPRDRYIGIERIGPDGERRMWPAIPFDLVGFDHPVHAGAEPPEGLPPVLISDEPIEFAGRMVTLYRIYRDPDAPTDDAGAYYRWDEAHAAGDLVWWGIMRDSGYVGGNRIWSIDCHGPDAMQRRQLGTRCPTIRTRIGADLELDDDESYVAIAFNSQGVAGPSVLEFYDSSIFDHQLSGAALVDRASLAAQLNTWIEDALSGSDTNVSMSGGPFDTWLDAAGNANPDAGITSEGRIFIRREDQGLNDDLTYGRMALAVHSRAWRKLGFEPETQHRDGVIFNDLTHCHFRRLVAGEEFTAIGAGTGVNVPGDGYIVGIFTTIAPGYPPEDIEAYDNDGGPRYWWPFHTSEVFVLDHRGGQVVRLVDEEVTSLYLEGQLTAGVSQFAEIDGSPTTRARWFVLEGEVVEVDDDPSTEAVELTDKKPLAQLVLASWVEGPQYGTVSDGGSLAPALFVERWLDPRGVGLNYKQRRRDWSGKTVGAGEIELSPLHTYHYFIDNAPFEQAVTLVAQILLSTGACEGYDAELDNGGAIAPGPNTHSGAPLFAGDYELADLGLGIPYQLVASPAEMREAFETLPGGANGDLCRLRLAYVGPFAALDVLESITRPRSLCWSLHGKRFGVFRLGPVSPEDADVTITESDLWGTPGDPTSTIPTQQLRATGQVDGVNLAYRHDPAQGKTAELLTLRALDPGASRRTGELVEDVKDHGLAPDWYPDGDKQLLTGVDDWRPLLRQLWQRDVPEFFARRHFATSMTLQRMKGQDVMPGTSVSITNRWLVNPAGGYGVTGATGRVVRAEHNTHTGACKIEAIVFAVAGPYHYAPMLRVRRIAGTTVEWYPDHFGHGDDEVLDGTGLIEPEWSTTGGAARVTLFERQGEELVEITSAEVSSIDLAARTLVISGSLAGSLRDRDRFIVLSPAPDQDGDSWTLPIYGQQANEAETQGTPYIG
jgi:hypothetical protein